MSDGRAPIPVDTQQTYLSAAVLKSHPFFSSVALKAREESRVLKRLVRRAMG